MEIKELNKNQKKQIDTILNKRLKEEFKTYYDDIKENRPDFFKGVSFTEFISRLRELVLNGFENETQTLISGYFENESDLLDRLYNYDEDINYKDTEELLNFDEDTIREETRYFENEYITESLNEIFNQDISKKFKNSYDDIFIGIYDEDVYLNVLYELKDYDTFKDFIEYFEDLVYDIDLNDLIIGYIYNFHFEVFRYYVDVKLIDEEQKTLLKNIHKNIKIELKERKIKLKEEIKKDKEEHNILKIQFKEILKSKELKIQTKKVELSLINKEIKNKEF